MTPRDIDLATLAAWPAAVAEERHGWHCLAAGGVTGRVNAAWPLAWTGASVETAIDEVEAWYAARGLPARFKLTDGAVAPADLAGTLARRGYEPAMETLIMTAPLPGMLAAPEVTLYAAMPEAFDAALRETARDAAEYEERRAIAARAPKPAAFAMIERAGRAASIGMMAQAGALAGIFLMRTIPDARRQGLARAVLAALLGRAARQGAQNAFLQVECDNAGAIALYASAGFSTLTSYRFWRKAR